MRIIDRRNNWKKSVIYVVEAKDMRTKKYIYMVFNSKKKIESWDRHIGNQWYRIKHVEEVPFKVIGRYLTNFG